MRKIMRLFFGMCALSALTSAGMDRPISQPCMPASKKLDDMVYKYTNIPTDLRKIVYAFVGRVNFAARYVLPGGFCAVAPHGIVHSTRRGNEHVITTITERGRDEKISASDACFASMNGIFLHKNPGLFAWPKNNCLEIWNWDARKCERRFLVEGLNQVLELPDGTLAASHHDDGGIACISHWSIDGMLKKELGRQRLIIKKMMLLDNQRFLSAGVSCIKIWNAEDHHCIKRIKIGGRIIDCTVLSPYAIAVIHLKRQRNKQSETIVSQHIVVCDIATGSMTELCSQRLGARYVTKLSGDRLAIGYSNGAIDIVDSVRGYCLQKIAHGTQIFWVNQLLSVEQDDLLVLCTEDETRVWQPTQIDAGSDESATQRDDRDAVPVSASWWQMIMNKIFGTPRLRDMSFIR